MLLPEDKLTLLCSITIAGKNIISSGSQRPAGCPPDTAGPEEKGSVMGENKLGRDLASLLVTPQEMFSDLKVRLGYTKNVLK